MSAVASLLAAIESTDRTVRLTRPRIVAEPSAPPKPSAAKAPPVKPPPQETKQSKAPEPKKGVSAEYKAPISLSPEAKTVVDTVASVYPPAAIVAKLLTGGTVDDWTSFVTRAKADLAGKGDNDISPARFGEYVTQFVALRASLTKSGYTLPNVTIPVLETASGIPTWVYVIGGIAALVGVAFGIRAVL